MANIGTYFLAWETKRLALERKAIRAVLLLSSRWEVITEVLSEVVRFASATKSVSLQGCWLLPRWWGVIVGLAPRLLDASLRAHFFAGDGVVQRCGICWSFTSSRIAAEGSKNYHRVPSSTLVCRWPSNHWPVEPVAVFLVSTTLRWLCPLQAILNLSRAMRE